MSYIFSRALVAEFSPANYSGTDVSAPSSGSPTPKPCLWHDKTTEASRLSRFGMTCEPLTAGLGVALLTSFVAASRAKTYQPPEKAQASTASAAACGQKWRGSLAKYDPDSSSWRTAQHSLLGDSEEFLETWPRWGMTVNGECWERPMLAHRTSASGSGLWQTPVADDAVNRVNGKWNSRGEPKLSAQVMQWPTPTASEHTGAGHGPNKNGAMNLRTMVQARTDWPTPTVCGNYNRNGASATSGDGLATAVSQRTFPTATAYKGWSPNHNRANTDDRLDYTIEREGYTPGQDTPPMRLSPDWVELLMGWPKGWTDLRPLGTATGRTAHRESPMASPTEATG